MIAVIIFLCTNKDNTPGNGNNNEKINYTRSMNLISYRKSDLCKRSYIEHYQKAELSTNKLKVFPKSFPTEPSLNRYMPAGDAKALPRGSTAAAQTRQVSCQAGDLRA